VPRRLHVACRQPAPWHDSPVRVGFLTTILTDHPRVGSEVATTQIRAALLAAGAELHTFGFHRRGAEEKGTERSTVIDVRPIETADARYRRLYWAAEAVVRRRAYSETKYRSRRWRIATPWLGDCDTVVLDHSQLGFLKDLPAERPPRVIACMHNVEHELYAEEARLENFFWRPIFRRESRHMRTAERELVEHVDEIWVFTESDADGVRELLPSAKTRVLPMPGNPLAEQPAPDRRDGIRLIGTWTWRPNREALEWFLEHVAPQLPADVDVTIAGPGGKWIPDGGAIRYAGFVPDALEFLREAGVVAIPTRSGGGIQIKTLDALSVGVPVVATPVAMRGIDDPPPSAHVADSPGAFAEALMANLGRPGDPAAGGRWAEARRESFRKAVAAGVGL
jgi:glycosyltransferase involved in cell wall biosynthesis